MYHHRTVVNPIGRVMSCQVVVVIGRGIGIVIVVAASSASSSQSSSLLLLLFIVIIMIHVTSDPPIIEIKDLRVIITSPEEYQSTNRMEL